MFSSSTIHPDQGPAISVPFRFFLTAPFFAALAGLLLAALPETNLFALSVRHPAFYAVVHLVTIGFFTQVMFGALFQMLPVIAGVRLRHSQLHATVIQSLLIVGLILFVGGMHHGRVRLTLFGGLSLFAGFFYGWAVFVFSILRKAAVRLHGGWRTGSRESSMRGWGNNTRNFFFTLLGLFVGLMAALFLALIHGGISHPFSSDALYTIHLLFMLIGFVYSLIVTVVIQTVPMFFGAPEFSRWSARWTVPLIQLALLMRAALYLLVDLAVIQTAADVLLSALLLLTPLYLLRSLRKRNRRIPDLSVFAFEVGSSLLIASILLYGSAIFLPAIAPSLRHYAVFLFLLGGAGSILIAMLHKIVPFLVWFHLTAMRKRSPSMGLILPDLVFPFVYGLHLLALSLYGIGVFVAPLALRMAGAAFLLEMVLLFYGILQAVRVYWRSRHQP